MTVEVSGPLFDEGGNALANMDCVVVAVDDLIGQSSGGRVKRGVTSTTNASGVLTVDLEPGRHVLYVNPTASSGTSQTIRRHGNLLVLVGETSMTLEEALDTNVQVSPGALLAAEQAAQEAADSATAAATSETNAAASEDAAQDASASALASAVASGANIYPTISDGIAAVAVGDVFMVPITPSGGLDVREKTGASASTSIGRILPPTQSPNDTTEGRIAQFHATRGIMGLGGTRAIVSTDWNNIQDAGFYTNGGTRSNEVGGPGSYTNMSLLNMRSGTGGSAAQLATRNVDISTDLYVRTSSNFPMSDSWEEIYHTGNISEIDATDQQIFKVDGTEYARIDSDGKVGIGTSSPQEILHLSKDNPTIWVDASSTGETTFDGKSLNGGLLLTAFGMNTTNKYTPAIMFGSTDEDFTSNTPRIGAAIIAEADQTFSGDIKGAMNLSFWTRDNTSTTAQNAQERLRIDSDGNVGIGTSSPSAKLEVIEGNTRAVSIKTDGHIQLYDNTGDTRAYTFLSRDRGNSMVGGNVRLDASVTTGSHIGYSNGTDKRGGSGIIFENKPDSDYGETIFVQSNDTDDDTWVVRETMRIDSDGNVGIGTSNPGSKLSVVGLPTSSAGLSAGDIYIDAGTLKIVT